MKKKGKFIRKKHINSSKNVKLIASTKKAHYKNANQIKTVQFRAVSNENE